jgi:hypothetical protein
VVSIGVEVVCPVFGTNTINAATTATAVNATDPRSSRTRARCEAGNPTTGSG